MITRRELLTRFAAVPLIPAIGDHRNAIVVLNANEIALKNMVFEGPVMLVNGGKATIEQSNFYGLADAVSIPEWGRLQLWLRENGDRNLHRFMAKGIPGQPPKKFSVIPPEWRI